MSHDNQKRLGPLAMALMIEEAGDEKPNGSHLEAAIARLQEAVSIPSVLLEMSESILRLRTMIMAAVLTDQEEIDQAMKQLHDAIGKDIVRAAKESAIDDAKLAQIDAQLTQRMEQSFLPTKARQIEPEDRER